MSGLVGKGEEMKRIVLVTVVLVVLAAGFGAARAEARVGWPAECKTFRCVNKHMNNLNKRIGSLNRRLKAAIRVNATQTRRLNNHQALLACEAIVPLAQFGDPAGSFGYEFNEGAGTFFTSALDATAEDDPAAVWFVVDDCVEGTTARPLARGVHLRPRVTGVQR